MGERLLPARLLAALRPDPSVRFELPSDMAGESRRRIRVAAALGVAAYAAFLAVESSRVLGGTPLERSIDLAHDALGLLVCAFLFVVAALPSIGHRAALSLALLAEVLLVAVISIAVPWAAFVRTGHLPGITWAVPVVLLFPLLVPAPPRTVLLVSVVCALTMPLGRWALASSGRIDAAPADYWAASVAGAVAVGIAVVASRTIHGANRQVAAARRVGSYELIEPLGRGGMGEVWKAHHALLARPAAVKRVLPEALQGPADEREAVVRRFTREAQVTASLRSPHTVELFDFGVSADGTFYYAMELLDGMNAEHFVYRFGSIEPRRAVHWLKQACHSLAEAHDRGLVHRDVKPSNLMICRYGRDVDFVKVLDFGLTKPVAATEDSGLTTKGVRMGTPGFMAPEQVFGLPAESRTDVYALGCVAYWLLAGRKPFEAESAGEMMRLHAQVAAPPLAGASERRVPAALEAVVMACLSKEPGGRPASADELCARLDASLGDERWTEREAQEWWDLNLGRGS